jgi:hypothetical protein
MKRRQTFVLTFSTNRLVALLEEAGWEVRPRAGFPLVQFVSTPADGEVFLETSPGIGSPWERATGVERPDADRRVETARGGQYL